MTDGTKNKLRIAIIGSCQVTGLRVAVQRMLPDAEVKSWHVGVPAPPIGDTDEALLAQLAGFDFIISQLSDWDSHILLRISRLRDLGLPVIYLPTFVFAGFHPDSTYVIGSGGLVRGAETDYHSIIIAASFQLGIPAERVAPLFNAYVFVELGYFDVFEASKTALIASFEKEGFDLRPYFDHWRAEVGQFMYTINHPHIMVLANLARLALVQTNLILPDLDLSDAIEDYLADDFIFPTYPALARKFGCAGSTTILRGRNKLKQHQLRDCSLAEFININYLHYHTIQPDFSRSPTISGAAIKLASLYK